MTTEGDAIAAAVLDQFDRLPPKRKPINRGNGVQEWVPLSGIVVKCKGWLQLLSRFSDLT